MLVADPRECARRHSDLLISLHYEETLDHEAFYQTHRDWAEQHARRWAPSTQTLPEDREPERPLRIGYLSGSFNGLILGHFLHGLLARLDPERFPLHTYSSIRIEDEHPARLRAACARWVDLRDLDDVAAAERIRAAAADILVDLDGHSPPGRPLILARKPAPVQVDWLDWLDTTGMAAAD